MAGRTNYWQHGFAERDSFTERRRDAQQHQAAGPDDGQPCARGEWCARAERSLLEDGTTARTPARSYQPFCHTDRAIIGECIDGFPALYGRLASAIGDFLTAEILIRAPFDSSVLLRVDIDGLMRLLVDVACSWHERVAEVAALTAPDTQRTRRLALGAGAGALLPPACGVLTAHLDALLSLSPGEMMRPQLSWLASVVPDAPVTGAWRDSVMLMLGGADAGSEVLKLDYLGRAALLETEPGPARLLGVPCRGCDRRTLRRAPPPQHEGDREWFSQCGTCRDLLDYAEYTAWVRANAAYYVTRVTPAQIAAGRVA
jgi:hypothetical protein